MKPDNDEIASVNLIDLIRISDFGESAIRPAMMADRDFITLAGWIANPGVANKRRFIAFLGSARVSPALRIESVSVRELPIRVVPRNCR